MFDRDSRPRPLLSQLIAVNALVATATVFGAIAVARLNLDLAVERRAFVVLSLALLLSVLANGVLLRRRTAPLEHLIATMEAVDLSAPGLRSAATSADSDEVARLAASFNRMVVRLEDERRAAGRLVLRAHEQERARIAQDLHDEVNQALTAVLLRLEASAQEAPPQLARELGETKKLAQQAMTELLALARELRPSALDDHGLVPALSTQVSHFSERTGIESRFTTSGELPPLTPEQQLVIYRVTQESLSNIVKHAGARTVDVELSSVGGILLRIRDDGAGFVPRSAKGGLGLSGMRERALGVGGRLSIHSAEGQGTTVELSMEAA